MKPGTITHTIAVALSSISALFTHGAAGAVPAPRLKLSKKSSEPKEDKLLKFDPVSFSPMAQTDPPLDQPAERFPWRTEIVTTVF
ncbi:MAG: hypothetical protein ACJ8M4_05230, partial [Chthoniobacterales bacterium]